MNGTGPRHWWTALGAACLALLAVVGIVSLSDPAARRASSAPAGNAPHEEPPNLRALALGPVAVWLVLLVLLAGSAWSSYVPLGSLNPTINLVLAAIMLLVLAVFLMDLKSASSVLRLVAAAGLFWAIFLFVLTFTDYLSRRPTLPPAASHAAATGTDRFEPAGRPQ